LIEVILRTDCDQVDEDLYDEDISEDLIHDAVDELVFVEEESGCYDGGY